MTMRVAMMRYTFKHPGPQNPIATNGTGNLSFKPSAITSSMDGFVSHVGVLRLQVFGRFTVPAGGRVTEDDWDLLLANDTGSGAIELSGINLSARGETPVQCTYLSARRIQQSVATYAGLSGDLTQTGTLIDNSAGGAPLTVPVALTYTLRFFDERWLDPFKYVLPLQWWTEGTWQFQFSLPSQVFGAGYAWAAQPGVQLNIDLLMARDIILAAPFEWREKMNQVTTGATTYWDPGIYDVGGYLSPKFGGDGGFCSDDLAKRVQAIFNPEFTYRFPNNLLPADWAGQMASEGAPAGSPFGTNLSSLNSNGTPILACIRLFGPDWIGHRAQDPTETQLTQAKQIAWTVNLVGGQSLSVQHQFYMARQKARPGCGPDPTKNPSGTTGAVLLPEIIGQLKNDCGNTGFANFTAYIPPGHNQPPPTMWPRSTLIARRR